MEKYANALLNSDYRLPRSNRVTDIVNLINCIIIHGIIFQYLYNVNLRN